MNENTLHRLKKYIDSKGISVRMFEQSIGVSNGSFASQLKNNKTIGVDRLENILQIYPDINTRWLLTGKGNMILKEESNIIMIDPDNPTMNLLLDRIERLASENSKLKEQIEELKTEKKYKNIIEPDIAAEPELRKNNPGKNK